MRTSANLAVLIAVGALVITLVYLYPQWATSAIRQLTMLAGFVIFGVGLAAAAYAVGFARAERKYASRLSSLTADVERKKRELSDISEALERRKKLLAAARRDVAAARYELGAKRRQLAVVSGKLGDKEKRLKKIRKVVGTS